MPHRPAGPRAAVIALTASAAIAVASATAPADEGASVFRTDLVPYTRAVRRRCSASRPPGSSLVIHEKANPDRVADPAGFPGKRIACGNLLPRP